MVTGLWSPIWSVIIRVSNKIGRLRSRSAICLITSRITDQIGRHEFLLPIYHNFNKICDILGSFFKSVEKELCCLDLNYHSFHDLEQQLKKTRPN